MSAEGVMPSSSAKRKLGTAQASLACAEEFRSSLSLAFRFALSNN
jgi:hypothetical protein